MKKVWREPTLDEILNDPTLDTLLARDGVSKDELNRIIEGARETLARVPRSWQEGQEVFSSSISAEIPLLSLRPARPWREAARVLAHPQRADRGTLSPKLPLRRPPRQRVARICPRRRYCSTSR